MSIEKKYRGRIAPTPSGLLHIGHAQTFKIACKRARERNGKIVLRIEDIDRMRCTKEFTQAAIDDLKLVGLHWDEGVDIGGEYAPYMQSERFDFYWSQIKKLSSKKLIYVSDASRTEIKKLGIFPKRKFDFCEAEILFPRELRNEPSDVSNIENEKNKNWRFIVPQGREIEFIDNNFGKMKFVAGEDFGDFLVWRKSGEPSYELAVVADDSAMGITEVVRGKDLLLSTARQILLYEALEFSIPEFFHCELLRNKEGEKISKSSTARGSENEWLIRNCYKL